MGILVVKRLKKSFSKHICFPFTSFPDSTKVPAKKVSNTRYLYRRKVSFFGISKPNFSDDCILGYVFEFEESRQILFRPDQKEEEASMGTKTNLILFSFCFSYCLATLDICKETCRSTFSIHTNDQVCLVTTVFHKLWHWSG